MAATDPKGIDKMPLRDFVYSVMSQYAEGVGKFEQEQIEKAATTRSASVWMGDDAQDLNAAVVLKPMKLQNGTTEVWVDIDEPSTEQRTSIPIPLRRRAVKPQDPQQ
jgi:hypothetical protein